MLIMRIHGTCVLWWTIIHNNSTLIISSSLSRWQYLYPFLLMGFPKNSSTFASFLIFRCLDDGPLLHKPNFSKNWFLEMDVLLSKIMLGGVPYNRATQDDTISSSLIFLPKLPFTFVKIIIFFAHVEILYSFLQHLWQVTWVCLHFIVRQRSHMLDCIDQSDDHVTMVNCIHPLDNKLQSTVKFSTRFNMGKSLMKFETSPTHA